MTTKNTSQNNRIGTALMLFTLLFTLNATAQQWSAISNNNFNSLNTGNIGIGGTVTASDAKLNITGSATIWQLSLKNSSPGAGNWLLGSSATSWATGGGKFIISNSFASTDAALVIDASKNVGIGKTSPAYKLDVNGAINASAYMLNGAPINFSQWANGTSGNINFATGVVSIGTTNAPNGYRLAVGGKAIAEEIVVKLQANWPDYVFDDDYKLPSLAELELYIRKNKHLPEVPSAEEVAKNGVAIGEINTVLLKKIEELTLQMIALNKEVQALKKQK